MLLLIRNLAISWFMDRSSPLSWVIFVASFAALSASSLPGMPRWLGVYCRARYLITRPCKFVPNGTGVRSFTFHSL